MRCQGLENLWCGEALEKAHEDMSIGCSHVAHLLLLVTQMSRCSQWSSFQQIIKELG